MGWRRPLAFVPVVGLLAAAAPVWDQGAKPSSTPPAIVDNFSIHVLLRDGRGSALFRRVAHDRLLPDGP